MDDILLQIRSRTDYSKDPMGESEKADQLLPVKRGHNSVDRDPNTEGALVRVL